MYFCIKFCFKINISVFSGINATIFAYGATGSGKTYTLTGSQTKYEERGLIPRTIEYLFQLVTNVNFHIPTKCNILVQIKSLIIFILENEQLHVLHIIFGDLQ